MDFIDLNFSNIVVSKKKVIPVHYQKRYKANISNSAFNQSFAIGVYKKKVKSLLENNKCLVTAVQNYRCESSLKEKMWTETSSVNMEHIFSARLKLNKLAEVLKEACLSVEEILSVLQLCSSVFPSEFTRNNRKSCSNKRRRRSTVSLIKPIKEAQEWLSKPEDNFLTDVLLPNQDESNPASPSTLKDNESAYKSNSTDLSTTSNENAVPQELTIAPESVEPATLTSSLTRASFGSTTKNLKEIKKVIAAKSRGKRKPSESKANRRLSNKRSLGRNSENGMCIPVSDEVLPILQGDPEQANLAKKSKLSIGPTTARQRSVKQKLPLSSTKNNDKINARSNLSEWSENENGENLCDEPNHGSGTLDLINQVEAPVSITGSCLITDAVSPTIINKINENKDTLGDVSGNENAENVFSETNHANGTLDPINQCEIPVSSAMDCLTSNQDNYEVEISPSNLPEDPKQNEPQSHETSSSSCEHDQNLHDSDDIVQEGISQSTEKPKAQKSSKGDQGIHELSNDYLTSCQNGSNNGNNIPKSIMVTESAKSSANKSKTRNKVNFSFDDDTIVKRVVKSNQRKKKLPRMCKVSGNKKGPSNCTSPQRPVLHSVENISYLSENLSKNILVVSAEIHPPPSDCVPMRKQSISPRSVRKNMQPCVLLTDIFEAHKPISSCDSLEDLSACSGVRMKEGSNSKVSKKENKDSAINTENSLPTLEPSERTVARCRNTVSYKEPTLNRKMRRI